MNNASCLGRFGRYFAYDLRRAWDRGGLSALCVGILPLIGYLFGLAFYLIGFMDHMPTNSLTMSFVPIATMIYILVFPVKLYGEITDRRIGSNFLMISASTGAKFASMAILLLVILPIALIALFVCSDLILSLIPSYGGSLISKLLSSDIPGLKETIMGKGVMLSDKLIATTTLEQAANFILFFTLGALIFKKKKTGKTILSYIAIMSVIVLLIYCIGQLIIGDMNINDWQPSKAGLAIFCHTINIGVGVLLGYFIYYRLKKIEL